jgi:hypothetical protein
MVQLAIKLWGEPTRAAWREFTFANGTKHVSPVRGTWFDFETSTGGDTRDLMKMVQDRANNPNTTETPNVLALQWHGDAEPEDPPWLIRNRLPETGKGLLVAQWGMFKTFCALDISAHAIMGWEWTGEPVYRQCGVLCIAKEGSSSIPCGSRRWSRTSSTRVWRASRNRRSTRAGCLLLGQAIAQRCLAQATRFLFSELQPSRRTNASWISTACRLA